MNKLPIFGGVFELVGLGVTSWFAYRYLFNAADRCVRRRTALEVSRLQARALVLS